MRTLSRTLLVALIAVFCFSSVADARPGRRHRHRNRNRVTQPVAQPAATTATIAAAKPVLPKTVGAELKLFAERNQMATAMHGNKLYIKVDTPKLQANYDAFCKIGDNKVLEFNGRTHLFTRFNGKRCADFLENLDLDTFSAPTQARVSVIVKLDDKMHTELNRYITAANANPRQEIGTFNYGGGRPKRYYPGSTTANCTSWISSAKLDGKQSLAQSCGVWDSASPSSWIQSLARKGNQRVEAVLLHKFSGDVNNWREVDAFMTSSMKH